MEFKKSVEDYLKTLFRKSVDEASQLQIFQAVAYSVKELIVDEWFSTHKEYEKQDVKTVYYMSRKTCSMLPGFTFDTWLYCLWLWYQI